MNKIDHLVEYLKMCENDPSTEKWQYEFGSDKLKAIKELKKEKRAVLQSEKSEMVESQPWGY